MTTTTSFDTGLAAAPPHVPAELVRDFDYRNEPLFLIDPHRAFVEGMADAPDIFWSPRYGGHWVLKRYEDIREAAREYENFQHFPASLPALVGRPRPMLPIEVEPPLHQRYRFALAPLFAPPTIKALEPQIRAMAEGLIDGFAGDGGTEFVASYCAQLPVRMFLRLIGVPEEQTNWLRDLHGRMFAGDTVEIKQAAGLEVNAWLEATLAEKRRAPDDKVLSALIRAEPEGGPFDEQELIDLGFQLFTAGLDTVTNSLSMTWRYLAEHPEKQAEIRGDPAIVPGAVDELLRYSAIVTMTRRLTQDLDFRGLQLRKGEAVLLPTLMANQDPDVFPDGADVDFTRKVNNHLTFGAGAHRCLGSHLARAEMIITMQAWFERIGPFRIAEDAALVSHGGPIQGLVSLPLRWEGAR